MNGFLPPAVQQRLRGLVLESTAVAPRKGILRGQATTSGGASGVATPPVGRPSSAGAVVVFKGQKRIRGPGSVTLRLKLTGAGKRLLRHSPSGTLPLSIAVTFSGRGTKVTQSRTLTLSH